MKRKKKNRQSLPKWASNRRYFHCYKLLSALNYVSLPSHRIVSVGGGDWKVLAEAYHTCFSKHKPKILFESETLWLGLKKTFKLKSSNCDKLLSISPDENRHRRQSQRTPRAFGMRIVRSHLLIRRRFASWWIHSFLMKSVCGFHITSEAKVFRAAFTVPPPAVRRQGKAGGVSENSRRHVSRKSLNVGLMPKQVTRRYRALNKYQNFFSSSVLSGDV